MPEASRPTNPSQPASSPGRPEAEGAPSLENLTETIRRRILEQIITEISNPRLRPREYLKSDNENYGSYSKA
jgi:hypothetical protein